MPKDLAVFLAFLLSIKRIIHPFIFKYSYMPGSVPDGGDGAVSVIPMAQPLGLVLVKITV